MADTLEIFGTEYTGVIGIIATDDNDTDLTYIRPQGTKSITQNGTGIDVAYFASVDVNVSGGGQPNLQAKTYNVSSAGTATVTADSGYDGLSSVEVSVPSASPYIGDATAYFTLNGQRKWRHNFEVAVEVPEGDVAGWLPDGYSKNREYSCNAIPTGTTVTPTESSQTIGDANYMMEGAVTVNAIPSNYVGSGITQRSSSDLTASGATVTVPSGYYSAQATKSVASGTAGTPTATKVVDTDDASALITPSVTNTTGYITGGTKTGTSFYVTARELVSGNTVTCDDAGNWDVAECETLVVPSGTAGTPTATKGSVSNHSISVTPSVTNTEGYITGGTKTGTAVTVSASELVSGTYTVDSSGTKDVTNYASASVPAGTAGTPSASKGAVSNHSVSVTPRVTNTTGWITGSTKTGTAVTVSASELVSGTLSLSDNGTVDCTNYKNVSVDIPFVTYYTGSSAPASSLGSNGDIYLKTV